MPTGYTMGIENGTIKTAKEYLLLCSRAFCIAIDLKDEPLSVPTPMQFEPNQNYTKEYEEQLLLVHKLKKMSMDDFRKEYYENYNQTLHNEEFFLKNMFETNAKYKPFLDKVKAWNPPESYQGIKQFAIQQIELCMYNQAWIDKSIREFENCKNEFDDSEEGILRFKDEMIEHETDVLEYYKKRMDDDIKNAKNRTEFMQGFIKSLEDVE